MHIEVHNQLIQRSQDILKKKIHVDIPIQNKEFGISNISPGVYTKTAVRDGLGDPQ